jgi:hypothetical protein
MTLLRKADAASEEADRVHRLTEMDTQFVSLVRAGANRQSKFFVVKADGSVVPAVEVVPDASDEPPVDETLKTTDPSAAAAGEEPAVEPAGSTIPEEGTAPDATSKLDVSAWLDKAGARARALAMEHAIAQALAQPSPVVDPPVAPESVAAAPVEPGRAELEAKAASLETELDAARARIIALEVEVREARKAAADAVAASAVAVGKANAALVSERARVTKLRGSIAQPSAMSTGEVPASTQGGAARTGWAGDLAAQVRAEEQKRTQQG